MEVLARPLMFFGYYHEECVEAALLHYLVVNTAPEWVGESRVERIEGSKDPRVYDHR